MAFWNNQHVDGRLWRDISKRQHFVILVHQFSGDLTAGYLAKNTFGHGLFSILTAADEGMRQRTTVYVFQFPPDGHAMGDTGRANAVLAGYARNVVCGRLTFHRWVGSEYHLPQFAFANSLLKHVQSQLLRPYSVQRREVTHQHEINTSKTGALLDRQYIRRILDNAQRRVIPLWVGTQPTRFGLTEIATQTAMANAVQCLRNGGDKTAGPVTVALEQMEGHPLCRLGPNARQTAQRIYQPT
jgi:hypothetical protein